MFVRRKGRSGPQVDASIAAALVVNAPQFNDRVEPLASIVAGNSTTAAFTSNSVYAYKFRVAEPITIANVEIALGATKAGHIDIAVATSADDGVTLDRVVRTGDYDIATLGTINAANIIPLSGSYQLVPGVDYYEEFGLTDGALTILRLGLLAVAVARGKRARQIAAVYSSGVPLSLNAGSTGTGAMPWIALTV